MDISGISNGLLQRIGNGATQNGDAVTIAVLRKALDLQSAQGAQATQLIEAAAQAAPDPAAQLGQQIDLRV